MIPAIDQKIMDSVSSSERVSKRRSQRNLESFLAFDFKSGRKLGILDAEVYNHAVQIMKEIDVKNLSWKVQLFFRFSGKIDLLRLAQYVEKHAVKWSLELQNDATSLILLEKQCAILEQKVIKHNNKLNGKGKPIPYINPLRKTLRLIIKYPQELGKQQLAAVVREISFDRFTTLQKLYDNVEQCLKLPIAVLVECKEQWQGDSKMSLALCVSPKKLFKNEHKEPSMLLDPIKNQPIPHINVLTVVYGEHDWTTAGLHMFSEGQRQAMPIVYQQGYSEGKIAGYREALEKIKAAFAGGN